MFSDQELYPVKMQESHLKHKLDVHFSKAKVFSYPLQPFVMFETKKLLLLLNNNDLYV